MDKNYERYQQKMSKIADIGHAIAVLSWDKEVHLPKGSARFRTQQIATLSGMLHTESTDPEFGQLLQDLSENQSLSEKQKRNILLSLRSYHKATLFSEKFIIQKSTTISEAYHAWIKARQENDFDFFASDFEKLVQIKRMEADKLGIGDHPYDALLDQFEPHLTIQEIDPIFEDIRKKLTPLVEKYRNIPIEDSFLKSHYPKDKQWEFGLVLLKNMGFDFDHGRQDISTHPFTTSFSPEDVRVTTRIDEHDLSNMTWSCIHEGGHGLYEQGLPVIDYGLPVGGYVSLAIHESQSRLWENHVGRSLEYWEYFLPLLKEYFPQNLSGVQPDAFYRAINRISPNLIRTEADELHYHFHIMIRYEIEKSLIEGSLEAKESKQVWNDLYQQYLGVSLILIMKESYKMFTGAFGSIGYFPTYSLGSFYAAQFYDAAQKSIPELNNHLTNGHNGKLLEWLRQHIHSQGNRYDAQELCKRVTGEELNVDYFITYATRKYNKIYGLEP